MGGDDVGTAKVEVAVGVATAEVAGTDLPHEVAAREVEGADPALAGPWKQPTSAALG